MVSPKNACIKVKMPINYMIDMVESESAAKAFNMKNLITDSVEAFSTK